MKRDEALLRLMLQSMEGVSSGEHKTDLGQPGPDDFTVADVRLHLELLKDIRAVAPAGTPGAVRAWQDRDGYVYVQFRITWQGYELLECLKT